MKKAKNDEYRYHAYVLVKLAAVVATDSPSFGFHLAKKDMIEKIGELKNPEKNKIEHKTFRTEEEAQEWAGSFK